VRGEGAGGAGVRARAYRSLEFKCVHVAVDSSESNRCRIFWITAVVAFEVLIYLSQDYAFLVFTVS
jgi:hypothetical protein